MSDNLGMRSEGYSTSDALCLRHSKSICLKEGTNNFSATRSREVYKKGFSYKRFVRHLLTPESFKGTAATFRSLFRRVSLPRVLKWLAIG